MIEVTYVSAYGKRVAYPVNRINFKAAKRIVALLNINPKAKARIEFVEPFSDRFNWNRNFAEY